MPILPLLVVTHWRPPVAGLEDLPYQQCGVDFYEMGMDMSDDQPFSGQSADDQVERTEAEKIDPAVGMEPDDPRYDGYRIHEYWIVTAIAPDNMEAPLFVEMEEAKRFNLLMGPAMASDERRLLRLREFAQYMANAFQIELSIRHFVADERESIYPTVVRSDESG